MAATLILHPRPQPPMPISTVSVGPRRASAEVYRRRRLAVLALVVGLGWGLLSIGHQADASRTAEAEAAAALSYVVQPGDTLWDIASTLSSGDDPRPLVYALDDIAGGARLSPGQRLVIPDYLLD